jgi:hypothetical protein
LNIGGTSVLPISVTPRVSHRRRETPGCHRG